MSRDAYHHDCDEKVLRNVTGFAFFIGEIAVYVCRCEPLVGRIVEQRVDPYDLGGMAL
jgi:hypothetical protein